MSRSRASSSGRAPTPGTSVAASEPVRGGHPTAPLGARSGIEQLRAMRSGEIPQPPLSRLTGMRLADFEPGAATFTMPLTGWLCDPEGRIPIGPLTIPADAAMACAIMTGLPARTPLTTSALTLAQLRPVVAGGALTARATVIEAGPPVALAEVSLLDEQDRLIARGSSLCVILPQLPTAPAAGPPHPPAPETAPLQSTPDPWQREPSGGGLAQLTGLVETAVASGEAICALPASQWFCAPPPGRVQGGVVALLADAAINAALRGASHQESDLHPLELKLNYLRPLASDGREARGRARVIQAGRRIAVATATVHDASGRPVAVATGSATARS